MWHQALGQMPCGTKMMVSISDLASRIWWSVDSLLSSSAIFSARQAQLIQSELSRAHSVDMVFAELPEVIHSNDIGQQDLLAWVQQVDPLQ